MSESGTSMMYQQQAVAFSARDAALGAQTNSTPESPPHRDEPDLVALCALKKSIIANLPATCTHCGAEYPEGSIIERKDGDIVAYCKKKGACGKSLVLFAGLDLTYPIYTKYCPFKDAAKKEPVVFLPEMITPPTTSAVPGAVPSESDLRRGRELTAQEQMQLVEVAQPYNRFQDMDMYQMHGITNPAAVCELCHKTYSAHMTGCDQNGWKETSRKVYALPADWPFYHASTGTWGKKPEHCTSS